jgi:putative ABC transport system permease protein
VSPLVSLRIAVRAILRHKMRSFLTTLGIMIGVAAVIAVVAIGEGAKARVEETFSAMGTNLLVLLPGSFGGGGMRGGFGSASTLTWDDLAAIRGQVTSVTHVAPTSRSSVSLVSDQQNWTTQIFGTTSEYFAIRNWHVARGSLFVDNEAERSAKVVVLGRTVAEMLFDPGTEPIGQIVRIKQAPFQVIGILESKGQSPMGQDYDDGVFVPIKAYQTKIQGGLQKYVAGEVFVSAASAGDTSSVEAQITALLRERHRIVPPKSDDFSVRNLEEFASAQQESTKTLTLLLACIAAISLLVGGIGIMNIMLVSVTERTREIGVRMAVGAKAWHILAQFLAESLVLSMAGGVIGVVLGLGIARRLAMQFEWPLLIRPDVIVLAVGFSAVVGVVFGLYPASRASELDPIEALRYE